MIAWVIAAAFIFGSAAHAETQEARGYDFLINGDYVGCGIPVDVMRRAVAAKHLIPAPIMAAFFPMAASRVFGPSGLPERNLDNADVMPAFNVFATPRGVKAMNFNCLSCHADSIDGRYVVGLGNRARDFTQDVRAFTSFLPLFAWTPEERRELALFQRAMNAIAPYIQTKTVGANPAINLTYALFANRNSQDFTWSDELTLAPPPTSFPPVDVPPWWRLSIKKSMFYNAEFAANHHRIMSLAAGLCIEDGAALTAMEDSFRDVEAYVKSLKAPAYPRGIDRRLAEGGKQVFTTHCAGCHGSYGEDGSISYTPRVIPIERIGTDRALMDQQTGPEYERFRRWGEAAFLSITGESFGVEKHFGYVVPPLNGIWATAPFLHNGSVPNLEGVLNSRRRPKYWQKLAVGTDDDYDVVGIGVRFNELSHGQELALPLTKRYIYDTTLKGYGNQGHTFGDQLTDQERRAVMEYLKTL